MSDQRLQDPEQRGVSQRGPTEPGLRTYGRAIDCAARGVPSEGPIASGHGRGAPQPGAMQHYPRG